MEWETIVRGGEGIANLYWKGREADRSAKRENRGAADARSWTSDFNGKHTDPWRIPSSLCSPE